MSDWTGRFGAGDHARPFAVLRRDPMRTKGTLLAFGLLGLLLVAYIGSYFLLVERGVCCISGGAGYTETSYLPSYRGGPLSEVLFSPLYNIDTKLRPEHWMQTRYHPDRLNTEEGRRTSQ